MADVHYYVKSTGSDTSPYDTWVKAATAVSTVISSAKTSADGGDRVFIWLDSNLSDSISANTQYLLSVYDNIMIRFISVDSSGSPEPPDVTDMLAGATITTSGAYSATFQNSGYFWGVTLDWVAGAVNRSIYLASRIANAGHSVQVWEDCTIKMLATGSGARLGFGAGGNIDAVQRVHFINTDVTLARSAIYLQAVEAVIRGGTFDGTLNNNAVFQPSTVDGRGSSVFIDGTDMSAYGTSDFIIDENSTYDDTLRFGAQNITMGSGMGYVTGLRTDVSNDFTYNFYNVSIGNSKVVEFHRVNGLGHAEDDQSIYLDMSDGTTSYGVKIVTTALCEEYVKPFRFKLGRVKLSGTASIVVKVEIAQDGTTTALQNDEICMDLEYVDDTTALSFIESDKAATILTTPADHATSTESWTGLSGTNKKQYLAVTTANTGKECYADVWVNVYKPSLTVYVGGVSVG